MLYIARMVNDSLMIGDDIEIKISRIEGNSVCLGINAPRELSIDRKESHKLIQNILKNKTRI